MTQPIDHAESLPTGLAGRINPVCDRFEAAWRSGERPRLEDFLPQVDSADQGALLRELLRWNCTIAAGTARNLPRRNTGCAFPNTPTLSTPSSAASRRQARKSHPHS